MTAHRNSLEVVCAQPSDYRRLAALSAASFAPGSGEGWTATDIGAVLNSEYGHGFIALRSDREAIGFTLTRTIARETELLLLGVVPAARHQGAASALISAAIDHVCALGSGHIFLEARVDNAAASALYKRFGFRPVGRRAAYYRRAHGVDLDAITWRLDLYGFGCRQIRHLRTG